MRARQVAAYVRVGDDGTACLLEDLSRGGLFLRTERPLPAGTALVLTLMKPGMRKGLQLTGRVARTLGSDEARARGVAGGVGIAFDALSPEATAALDELIRELGPPGGPRAAGPGDEKPRLMLQINGLMVELAELQAQVTERERELADLTEKLRMALVGVAERDAKLIQLSGERDLLRKQLAAVQARPPRKG